MDKEIIRTDDPAKYPYSVKSRESALCTCGCEDVDHVFTLAMREGETGFAECEKCACRKFADSGKRVVYTLPRNAGS